MRKFLVGSIAAALMLALAAVAVAQTPQFEQTFSLNFSTKSKSKSAGIEALIAYVDNGGPLTKPTPTRKISMRFNPGTRFDTNVPAICKETDQGILNGKCPAKSKVGTGRAEANAQPFVTEKVLESITAYNLKNGIAFALKPQGLGQTAVIRAKITNSSLGAKLDVNVPKFPLPGGTDEAVLTKFDVTIKPLTKAANFRGRRILKPYILTPRTCKGTWKTVATFTYDDRSQKITSAAPCSRR